jgi:fused signal recognition particle receptor
MPEQNFYTLIENHPTEATIVLVVLAVVLYRSVNALFGSETGKQPSVSIHEDSYGRKTIDVESEIVEPTQDKNDNIKSIDLDETSDQISEEQVPEQVRSIENKNVEDIDVVEENTAKETIETEQVLEINETPEVGNVDTEEQDLQEKDVVKVYEPPKVESNFFKRGLQKSRGLLSQVLPSIFGADIDEDLMEDFEDSLLVADVGVEITDSILELVRKTAKNGGDIRVALREELIKRLDEDVPLEAYSNPKKPHVIMVVGVNGSGKTTTIGKLAHRFVQEGRRVLLAPGDTFRAGAVAQLKTWAERSGADFVDAEQDSDAASVIYSAIERAQNQNYDVVICDTAGRLQAQSTLMDELAKIVRVAKKLIPEAPHETILVLDSTIGQNALLQAEGFSEVADLTGIALTKLDGSAKGGVVIAVRDTLKLPIQLIGLGESLDALQDFHREFFVDALLDEDS